MRLPDARGECEFASPSPVLVGARFGVVQPSGNHLPKNGGVRNGLSKTLLVLTCL